MHPTATAPHGVVTRQSVVPTPPILVPHVAGAACAARDVIVTIRGAAHAATTACLRNLLLDRPWSTSARGRSSMPFTLGGD